VKVVVGLVREGPGRRRREDKEEKEMW